MNDRVSYRATEAAAGYDAVQALPVTVVLDNVRSAIALSLSCAVDPFIAVKMAVALDGFWTLRGYATEGRSIVRTALALPAIQQSDVAQAWALYVGAGLAESQSDHAEARRMLERLRGIKLLQGYRGAPAADLDAVCEAIARISEFAVDYADQVAEIDVNPLLARADGAVALDALIVMREP